MATDDLAKLKKLVADLRRAKNNQAIKDLDAVADEFGCFTQTTEDDENRIYYAPFKELNPARVTVAIPHRGKVKLPYVVRFIRMLENVIWKLEQGGYLDE